MSPVVEQDVSQENLGMSDFVALIPDIKPILKDQKILTDCQVNVGGNKKRQLQNDWE